MLKERNKTSTILTFCIYQLKSHHPTTPIILLIITYLKLFEYLKSIQYVIQYTYNYIYYILIFNISISSQKFFLFQICGKVFTKTYNLTVHMRMHQDIRPFPCTICEQTFRQKAHLQRHEATHGIDSTANRKRRKRPLMDDINELSKRSGTESEEELYRTFTEKRKFSDGRMKSEDEDDVDVDPMIEPIVGRQVRSLVST